MNKIKILSQEEAQKISAGEVVERPANVVKEIIENSIDANSSEISLYVEKSGKNLIRIVDNGCGMSPDDAQLCFQPHATSKISKLEDLEKIKSFGFRGEALSSIKAVSKVCLITKRESDSTGVKLETLNNSLSQNKVPTQTGTDFAIKDLFYNTPVRKKFLKQDETEWNQVLNLFHAFCLSNLTIHFKIYKENRLVLNLPGVDGLKERISQIWGHNFSENMIELNYSSPKNHNNSETKFSGMISNHNFWRYGRQQIFFFVNNRYVKNTELSKALMKGYLNVLPPARFPAAFIFLNMENDLVDINVHPKKEEVSFAKPGTIKNELQKLIKETLQSNLSKQFSKTEPEETIDNLNSFSPISFNSNDNISQVKKINLPNDFNLNSRTIPTKEIKPFKFDTVSSIEEISREPVLEKNENKEFDKPKTDEHLPQNKISDIQKKPRIIGQLFSTYIIFENETDLIMIDQHAAHERILYEKYLKNFEEKQGTKLIFPQILNLCETDINIILKEKNFFLKQGIELDKMGPNQLAIKSSPPKIENHSLEELIKETISFIKENQKIEEDVFRKKLNEHVHSHMACKMAIKAGDVLDIKQMEKLIENLQEVDNRFICVHGRPTTWKISKNEIEKKFRRK